MPKKYDINIDSADELSLKDFKLLMRNIENKFTEINAKHDNLREEFDIIQHDKIRELEKRTKVLKIGDPPPKNRKHYHNVSDDKIKK